MTGRRLSKRAKIILIVIAAVVVVAGALDAVWWITMTQLSRETPAWFATAIDEAVRDSFVGGTDLEILRQLQQISTMKESSIWGRSLSVGVGSAPLLRRSMTDEDRRDMVLARDLLLPIHGNLSWRETAIFLNANPRILRTFRSYRDAVKQAMVRKRRT